MPSIIKIDKEESTCKNLVEILGTYLKCNYSCYPYIWDSLLIDYPHHSKTNARIERTRSQDRNPCAFTETSDYSETSHTLLSLNKHQYP